MTTYKYFLLDICHLVSIRECIVSLEQTTRKEHYSLQQQINKLNKEAENFSNSASEMDAFSAVEKKKSGPNFLKKIANKIQGKSGMTEQQIYAAIKSTEKKLKIVDQL